MYHSTATIQPDWSSFRDLTACKLSLNIASMASRDRSRNLTVLVSNQLRLPPCNSGSRCQYSGLDLLYLVQWTHWLASDPVCVHTSCSFVIQQLHLQRWSRLCHKCRIRGKTAEGSACRVCLGIQQNYNDRRQWGRHWPAMRQLGACSDPHSSLLLDPGLWTRFRLQLHKFKNVNNIFLQSQIIFLKVCFWKSENSKNNKVSCWNHTERKEHKPLFLLLFHQI